MSQPLRHICFKRDARLELVVQAAVVLSSDGENTRYLDISQITTTEGIDLNGLLPLTEMVGIRDEILAQAQLDADYDAHAILLPRVEDHTR